jgi:hypothetical protein
MEAKLVVLFGRDARTGDQFAEAEEKARTGQVSALSTSETALTTLPARQLLSERRCPAAVSVISPGGCSRSAPPVEIHLDVPSDQAGRSTPG